MRGRFKTGVSGSYPLTLDYACYRIGFDIIGVILNNNRQGDMYGN